MYNKILQLHCHQKLLGIIAGFLQVIIGVFQFLHKSRQLYYQNCKSTCDIPKTVHPHTFAIVNTEAYSFKSS